MSGRQSVRLLKEPAVKALSEFCVSKFAAATIIAGVGLLVFACPLEAKVVGPDPGLTPISIM